MAQENIMDAIGDIAREKGIEKDRLLEVIQEAVTAAAKRKFKQYEDIEARINTDTGDLEVFRYKKVAAEVTDPDNEIPLSDARKLDSLAEPGDEVEYEIDNVEVSRVISQTARQLIFQKIREAERETIFENFKDRVGEVLNGVVSRTERGRTFITFNQTEAILYRREQIPNERYVSGDHMRVILLDVLNDPREPSQLVISRGDPLFLIKLFEMEVPEIYDGIVEIVNAAREPGRRAKIAVRSNDPDVDAVGACVGLRGSRVQAIISELRGEKIDIIHYTEDLPTYVNNSLAPAELNRIKINEDDQEIEVEVDPDQLSLAIGRQGQNVRLASKLLGYKVNITSTGETATSLEEQIRQRLMASEASLGLMPGGENAVGSEVAEGAQGEVAETSDTPEAAEAVETAKVADEAEAPQADEGVESAEVQAAEAQPAEAQPEDAQPAEAAPTEETPEASDTPVAAEAADAVVEEAVVADEVAEPVAAEPETAEPVAAEPETAEPETAEPETLPPEAVQSEEGADDAAGDGADDTAGADAEKSEET